MRIKNNQTWVQAIHAGVAAVRQTHAQRGWYDSHDLINWLNDHRNLILNEIIHNYRITGQGTPAQDPVFIATRQIGKYLQDWLGQVKTGEHSSGRTVTLSNGDNRDGEAAVSVWDI
jgi:hypothetical protein